MPKTMAVSFCLLVGLYAAPCCSGEHPRLLFTDAAVAHLKEPAARAQVVAMAEKAKKDDMEALCLAYRVTGDAAYARRIRDRMMRDCRPPPPGEAPKSWGWGLGPAHKCYDIALGYDAIYDFLSPEERKTIREGLVTRGIEPLLGEWLLGETRTTTLDSMGHNFWSSCVFLPGVALLAIEDEEPRAKEWLDRIARATVEWFEYPGSVLNNKPRTFDRAGGFYESVSYASYALSGYLAFRLAWRNARGDGLPDIAVLDKVGDFFLDTCYPNDGPMMALNFGDTSLHAVGSRPLALLWADGMKKDRHRWYLDQVRDSDFKEALRADSALSLVYYPRAEAPAPAAPDRPTAAIYKDMGWATLRSSWDRNATLLGVKSGFTWNHAHADAGSFILFHRGENILIDSGNCWYVHPEYDAYYRQSQAHNVVLFNGEGENPEDTYHGSKFPGAVRHLVDAGDLKYVLADATGPVSRNFSRNYRSFLWLDDVILILDDLKTHRPGRFEWLLHVDGEAKRKGLDLTVRKGKAAVAVRPLFPERFPEGFPHDAPERVRLEERTGLKDHAHKTPVPYYAVVPPGEARVMKFVTAVLLEPDNPPEIERLEAVNAHGVRLRRGGRTTEVWFNLLADGRMRHRNSNAMLGGWDTDAYILAVTSEDGVPTRFFVGNGSYLRRDGRVLLDSLSKVFAVREDNRVRFFPE